MESIYSDNLILSWDKLCRICLSDQSILVPVYKLDALDEQYKMSFCKMLNTCSNLKVSSKDNLPQLICSLCITHMRHALEFRIKCQSSENVLTELLNKKKDLNRVLNCEPIDVKETDVIDYEIMGQTETKFVTNEEKSIKDQLNTISTKKENINSQTVDLKTVYTSTVYKESCSFKKHPSHIKTHPNTCCKCNITFKSVEEHKMHLKEHDENKCSECGKGFTSRRLCQQHKLIHAKDKSLCTICGKKFGTLSALNVHYRKHTQEQRYDCNYCGKKFMDWSSRRYHIRNHHTLEKPFACDICNSCFAHKNHLVRHMLIHSNEKPFTCTMCDSRFKRKSTLSKHMFKHTGEKRVFCTLCNKGFVTNHNLKVHMVTHTGEKNYVCSVCSKGFSQAHVLRTHMKTHLESATTRKKQLAVTS